MGVASRADTSWHDFRMEADVIPFIADVGIQIGGDRYSRFSLWLRYFLQEVQLDWVFTPPPGSGLEPREAHYSAPLVIPQRAQYRLGLGFADGEFAATVQGAVIWGVGPAAVRVASAVSSLAFTDDLLALSTQDQLYSVTTDGEGSLRSPQQSWVGETRTWDLPGERLTRIGVALPAAHQVLWGQVIRASHWDAALNNAIGPGLDARAGHMSYPLSLDAGPDGRVYVLDAGNSRVLVFDAAGSYITQWGGEGSEEGRFNLGDGLKIANGQNYAGSICVDDEGYIYVADVGNRRIQKFAP